MTFGFAFCFVVGQKGKKRVLVNDLSAKMKLGWLFSLTFSLLALKNQQSIHDFTKHLKQLTYSELKSKKSQHFKPVKQANKKSQ